MKRLRAMLAAALVLLAVLTASVPAAGQDAARRDDAPRAPRIDPGVVPGVRCRRRLGMTWLLAGNNFGDTRSGSLAGPMGLLIILLLAVGTILLIRNMNARLRRLPASFDEPNREDADTDNASTGNAPLKDD